MQNEQTNVYIFAGEGYLLRQALGRLKQSLDIQNEQVNVTVYQDMPKADELIEACAAFPFFSDWRLIVVQNCSVLAAKGSAEEAKKIAAYVDGIPHSTVLVLCTGDALDKRRTLYKQVKKTGQIKEFPAPKQTDCIAFVLDQAKAHGASISKAAAGMLVSIVGCDYYALENEIAKLVVFSGSKKFRLRTSANALLGL